MALPNDPADYHPTCEIGCMTPEEYEALETAAQRLHPDEHSGMRRQDLEGMDE